MLFQVVLRMHMGFLIKGSPIVSKQRDKLFSPSSKALLMLMMPYNLGQATTKIAAHGKESERQALLTFKRGLMYAYGNPGEVLPSWTSNNKDCCTWKGISTTSHVVLGSSTHASMVSHQVQNYCIETERQALLTFKRGLMYAYGNPGEVLPSWTSNNKDCCTWKGIRFIFGDLFLENCSPE
ncbi:uncharacterized protein LOC133812412 isoform X3 [Humulus lupulus]|uniref:uncharacterized protein LOC133812412 isoform X3 n=1 Tax=Humulus lupulus TaxID=3486 RepID=UPI002B413C51|nr:uncharacterized protein LOC133812412 isoform X3 [Humulus lupulus]